VPVRIPVEMYLLGLLKEMERVLLAPDSRLRALLHTQFCFVII